MAVVGLEVRGDVAIITLDRPEKLNAIDDAMLDGLLEATEELGQDEAIGAAVLVGRGRAFSAGGDITAMAGMDESTFAATIARYMRVATAIRACRVPIVAAVHGYAMAGGFELALLCDIRFAATGTQFGLPDTRLGLSPTSGMTWLLPRIIGLGRAMSLTLSAEPIDAEEALRVGLVSRVVEPETLFAEAEAFAHRLAGYPRLGVIGTKRGFLDALESDFGAATAAEAAAEIACFRTSETRARLRAFAERKRD